MDGDSDSQSWWQTAAVYHVYPLSYADSDGDGYGDLRGIIDHLDHLAGSPDSLGVDALWLSPIYRSPMVDFGYDVADHTDVDPRFGTLTDVDELIVQAHRRGLRVLLDFVPNHTSDRHPWFTAARTSRTDPYRNYYIWADPAPDGGPPNNWLSAFPAVGAAWTLDAATGQYYLHSYTPEQPDLNWRNPAVRSAMHDVMRFWLRRGVDGFRVDAPHRIAKDEQLRDNPEPVAALRLATQLDENRHMNIDLDDVHELLRGLRAVADEFDDRVLVGEIGVHHLERRRAYHGVGDEFSLIFDFGFWNCPWDAAAFRAAGNRLDRLASSRQWPTHALSNHDIPRHATRFGTGATPESRVRAAAVMLLTLPGTAFLYYGEEIGMRDVPVPAERAHDPDGRDPCRTPMQWARGAGAGFTTGRPWLPVGIDGPDVAAQRSDPDSVLALYRRLLVSRRGDPRLGFGDYVALDSAPEVYAYTRSLGGSTVLMVLNFAPHALPAVLTIRAAQGRVVLSTGRRPPDVSVELTDLILEPDEALVLDLGTSGADESC